MADAKAVPAEARNLIVFKMDTVCEPDSIVQPADLLKIVEWPAAEVMKAVFVFVLRFAEMGVQPAIMLFRERCGVDHQLLCNVERRTRRKRHTQESTFTSVVVLGEHAFAVGNDRVVVLHQALVGDSAA